MRFILSFVCLIVAVIADGSDEDLTPAAIKECMERTGSSQDDVKKVMSHEMPETKQEQCLMACIMKKVNMMKADNSINMKQVRDSMEPLKEKSPEKYNHLVKAFEDCSTGTPDKDECEAAKNFAVCVIPKVKKE